VRAFRLDRIRHVWASGEPTPPRRLTHVPVCDLPNTARQASLG
jgi:hypothetical protein